MIEVSILRQVAKLMASEDREMQSLGRSIFLGLCPDETDVEELNEAKGHPPIGIKRIEEIAKEQLDDLNLPDVII